MADSRLAVQSLMLTDELFRASNVATRKKYVQLVESVREHGGDVKICSALHVSGERTSSWLLVGKLVGYSSPTRDSVQS